MNKSKAVTLILLVMTVGLMMAIFYIGYVLTNTSEKTTSLAPQKTKAQSIGYNKIIPINKTATNTPIPKENAVIDSRLTPTQRPLFPTADPRTTVNQNQPVSPTAPALSPTETLLAYQNPTVPVTTEVTSTPQVTNTLTPTKAATLPQTGAITNAIILFAVSGLLIFFSFLF